jgi:hypothetical protein
MRTRMAFCLGIVMLLCIGQASAQTYFLSVENEDYTPVQGGQDIAGGSWNDPQLSIPIGFNFEFYTKTINEITLPSFFSIISILDEPSDIASVFILFGADLVDRGILEGTHLSPIKTVVTGSPGSRIFTLEFDNAGFYVDLFLNGSSTDFVNLQLKLYEETGDIVYHFGPRLISMPQLEYVGFDGPFMGIAEDFDLAQDVVNGEIILLSGDPLDPDVITEYGEFALGSTIPENTLYRFSREDVSAVTSVSASHEPFYFPNPATDFIYLKAGLTDEVISPVEIYSLDGRLVKRFAETSTCDISDLSAGWYELKFKCSAGIRSQKLVVLPD